MIRKATLTLMLALLAVSPAVGKEWARKMFESTEHDFGAVARGAKAQFEFVITNPYVEEVHIASVRSSCGCTLVSVENPAIKTFEKTAVLARINSNKFLGQRGATVTVTFDKPFYAEVQLQVKTYIRSDVVFYPDSVQFGTLEQGDSADRKISVTYAGRGDWQILDVTSANPYLSAEVVETHRSRGRVSYELIARLDPDAPAGYLQDHLVLLTNDRRLTQVPITVEGRLEAGITVSPSSLFMGVVEPGRQVTRQLVVQSSKPFRILSVQSDADCFEIDAPLA
ncbi:MAG: DUF1573 domain-containing protein, partial [Planctomycetes bacterium]|nr:DUF1573 domain-containing protein [Planctomycetota bacterium]